MEEIRKNIEKMLKENDEYLEAWNKKSRMSVGQRNGKTFIISGTSYFQGRNDMLQQVWDTHFKEGGNE